MAFEGHAMCLADDSTPALVVMTVREADGFVLERFDLVSAQFSEFAVQRHSCLGDPSPCDLCV